MRGLASALLVLLVFCSSASLGLTVSPNGRDLVDSKGLPFLVVGDAAWSLVTQITAS